MDIALSPLHRNIRRKFARGSLNFRCIPKAVAAVEKAVAEAAETAVAAADR